MNSATASATAPALSTYAGGRVSPSSNSTLSIASSTTASVPGRTKWCSVATLAVSVRRGSNTTIRPPRFLRSRSRFGKSGTVISEPLEAIGFAPKTRKYDVRSMSGTGSRSWWPYSCQRDELVRDLVDRRGAEPVAGAQRLDERDPVGGRAERVCVRVAEVDADGVASVPVDRAREPVGDQVERLVPRDLDPLGVRPLADPAHRAAQPVGVGVDVGERDPLGADVAAGERVGVVAADRGDPVTLDGQLEPADRLAEVAHAERGDGVGPGCRGRHPCIVPLPLSTWTERPRSGTSAKSIV